MGSFVALPVRKILTGDGNQKNVFVRLGKKEESYESNKKIVIGMLCGCLDNNCGGFSG